MDDKEFFTRLKEQIEAKPSRRFDPSFWARFNDEFGRETSSVWSFFSTRAMVPVAVSLALIGIIAVQALRPSSREMLAENQRLAPILEHAPMLEDLDLLLGEAGEDVASLSDEEWRLLLDERSG